ncbi:hypothetical protein F5Y08DRAFT_309590 [Xylaria arbuscula]|nr:hypothetical protein F5Y08DRAFT_309590 [Xylaria arbuscula]
MQPLYGSISCTVVRTLTRTYRPSRCAVVLIRHSYGGGHLIRRHASSRAPNPSKKPVAKPLPYQPAKQKAQLDTQQQQQQQREQKQDQRNEKAPISDLVRDRWFAILGFGTALACLGYFTVSLAIYWRKEPAPCYPLGCEPTVPTGRPSIQSPYEFDLHLDKSEWRYGITRLRREIGAKVRGHVLEVAIGTGRNFEFYNWDTVTASLLSPEEQRKKAKEKAKARAQGTGKDNDDGTVLSFTGVDISPGMLDIALQRVRQVVPHMHGEIPKKPSFAMLAAKHNDENGEVRGHVVSFLSDRIRLLQSDVSSGLPSPPKLSSSPPAAPQKYDTILQTFGLCSVQDPVSLLSTMASSLQPDTGRIVLLEHGRSLWDVVNGLLDRGAREHHERFGCWWNRDIEVIVAEAARRIPGLEILRLERPSWATAGTHVVVELRVKSIAAAASAEKSKATNKPLTGWSKLFSSALSTKEEEDHKGKKVSDESKKSD